MKLTTLYKKTATGAVQTWTIEVSGNSYRTISGKLDGKMIVTEWTECFPKNEGKSNETSGREQAIKEAEAKWQKKVDRERYATSLNELNNFTFPHPMLAYNYKDHSHKLNFADGVFVSTKLNGVRMIASKEGLFSRKGKRFTNCDHIEKALAPIFLQLPGIILDGEAFNPLYKNNLGDLVSCVSKKNPTVDDTALSKKVVQYWIYDIFDPTTCYKDRIKFLSKLFKKANRYIYLLGYTQVFSHQEINEYLEKANENLDEGIMVRQNSVYQFKRTDKLLKHKLFLEDEFIITECVEGVGNIANKLGSFILRTKDGKTFKASPIGSHDYWSQMWKDRQKLLGKKATVKYKELSPITEHGGGVPLFGKVVTIRDYE